MKTNRIKSFFKSKSFLEGMASLGWASLLLFFTTFVFLFAIVESITEGKGIVGFMVYYLIAYYIVLTVSCFFIVKKNPKSFWYVPMICNLLGIIAAFTESVFWEGLLWIIFGSGLVLSIIASIIGMLIGKRTTIHDKSETS
jgi:hypothetical protein